MNNDGSLSLNISENAFQIEIRKLSKTVFAYLCYAMRMAFDKIQKM